MGRINFVAVEFDKEKEIVSKYKVSGTPHLMFFSGGVKVSEIAGPVESKEQVTGMLDKALA